MDDDLICSQCGDDLNLDGYDGLCGACADSAYTEEHDDQE